MKVPDLSIIERVLDNQATAEEVCLVVTWFKSEEGQKWLSLRMDEDEKQIKEGEENAWMDHEIPSELIYRKIMRRLMFRKIRIWGFRVAAVLVPLVLFLGLFVHVDSEINLFAEAEYEEVTVPYGEHMYMIFQDGSKVHLNSGSRIRYPKKFDFSERKIELEGEGWFEVAKNSKRPFIVDLSCLKVRVLGTTFNVKAYCGDDNIFVTLQEGRVKIDLSDSYSLDLMPGEEAVYDRQAKSCKIDSKDSMEIVAAWRFDVISFKDTPLKNVLETLTRVYDVHFEVMDNNLWNYTYTLTSNKKDLQSILNDLQKITPIRFVVDGDKIIVKSL